MTAGFCAARSRLRRLNAGIYVDEAFKLLSTTKIEVCVVTAGFWAARNRAGRLSAGIYAGMRPSIPVKMKKSFK